MDNNKIVSELNDLLTRNYDAEAGYKEAAENVDHATLKQFFLDQAKNRYDFGHKVKQEIKTMGAEPNKGTSIEGDIHRAWLNFRDMLSSGNKALYNECIRGEKAAIEEYDEFLAKNEVPETVKTIFRDQKQSIQSALQQLEQLEDLAD